MLVFVLEITSWAKMMSCSQHWTILSMMSTIKLFLSIYCKIFKSIKIRSNSPEKTAHCKKYKTLDGPGCVTWYLFNKLLQPKSYQKEKHIIQLVASVCEEAKEWSLLLVVREGVMEWGALVAVSLKGAQMLCFLLSLTSQNIRKGKIDLPFFETLFIIQLNNRKQV